MDLVTACEEACREHVSKYPKTFHIMHFIRCNLYTLSPSLRHLLDPHVVSLFLCSQNPALSWRNYMSLKIPLRHSAAIYRFYDQATSEMATTVPPQDLEMEMSHLLQCWAHNTTSLEENPTKEGEDVEAPTEALFLAKVERYGGKVWAPEVMFDLVRVISYIDPSLLSHFPTCVVAPDTADRPDDPIDWGRTLCTFPSGDGGIDLIQQFHHRIYGHEDTLHLEDTLRQYLTRFTSQWQQRWTEMGWSCRRTILNKLWKEDRPRSELVQLIPELSQWMSRVVH
jgi:hypothetical protein